jgi:HSP20 family protein
VSKESLTIQLEKNALHVTGKVSIAQYQNLKPIHTDYNIGHFKRSFSLSNKIDQDQIEATMIDEVLTLRLPKRQEPQPRKIQIK